MKINLVVTFWLWAVSLGAIIGIDYGQQFTKAVMLAPGVQFEVLLTEEARRKDLSGISIRPTRADDLERIYGSAAQSLCTRFPHSCVTGIKSLLGKSFHDREVHDYLSTHFGVNIVEDKDRTNALRFDLGLKNETFTFSPEEMLAMSLKDIKKRALRHLEENPHAKSIVDDVAISIPPFASQEQRQAYIDALQLAGFTNVLGLVEEGTAVAANLLSNMKFEQSDYNDVKKYSLIYDMGAGSTKATLFSITPLKNMTTILELENVGFDESFGGAALTQSIYTILIEKLASQFGLDENLELPPRAAARLLEASEKAKTILSANSEYHVSLESVLDDKDFKAVITREEFEDINMDQMARITKPIADALNGAGVSLTDLESVVLTGGSTRVPFVQKHLNMMVGEDKIAKTVNADESCALGTTLKAFKSKTQFGKPDKDFQIVEKSFHNYEISVNDEESVVFDKSTIAGSTKKISLGDIPKDLNIQMFEDGRLFKSYNVDKLTDKSSSLTCNEDKTYTKEIFGTFEFDSNKIFSLKKLEAVCVKQGKDGFFKKLLNGEDEVEEEAEEAEETIEIDTASSTESTTASSTEDSTETDESKASASAKASKKVIRPVSITIPRPQYPGLKPMSKPLKERVNGKLNYLDDRDAFKVHLDNIKNKLEATCYELRNLVDDKEDIIEDELNVDDLRTKIADTIEWLDFESDESPITDFESKIKQLTIRKDEINNIVKMQSTDLSLEGLKKLYEDGTTIMMKIQSKMLEFGSEISDVRQKYDDAEFNFDKENDRIKVQLLSKGDDKMLSLDRTFSKYKDLLTDLGEVLQLNEKYFNKIDKIELFEKYEAISESIVDMLADLLLLDESHQDRIKMFNDKYEKLKVRKQQKEFRDKLKQEKARADEEAKAAEEEEVVEEEQEHEQDTETEASATSQTIESQTSSETASETQPVLEHDEL